MEVYGMAASFEWSQPSTDAFFYVFSARSAARGTATLNADVGQLGETPMEKWLMNE